MNNKIDNFKNIINLISLIVIFILISNKIILNSVFDIKSENNLNKYLLKVTNTTPYVSSTTWYFYSNHFFVEHSKSIQVNRIKDGDLIFIRINLLDKFFKEIYSRINKKIILITHNNDDPTDVKYLKYLTNDNKIIKWYSTNPGFFHSKHIPIPIGFQTNYLEGFKFIHRTFHTLFKLVFDLGLKNEEKVKFIRKIRVNSLKPWNKRKNLLYANFKVHKDSNYKKKYGYLDPGRRDTLKKFFKNFSNAFYLKKSVKYHVYMKHLEDSKFVLCPQGFGMDSYRYIETILMGAIPIVQNSTLYPLFLRSTTLILNNLTDLTDDMLQHPELYIKDMSFSRSVIYMDTWIKEIEMLRKDTI